MSHRVFKKGETGANYGTAKHYRVTVGVYIFNFFVELVKIIFKLGELGRQNRGNFG